MGSNVGYGPHSRGHVGPCATDPQLVGQGQGVRVRKHVAHVRDAGHVEAQRLVERRRGVEHEAHGCDAGGVEAQRLVERRRACKHAAHGCDAGRVEAQRPVERIRGVEHRARGCDAGGIETQRLVKRRRACKHEAHVCDAGRVEAQRLVERRRGVEHESHGCDAGGVEAQRLVEVFRVLEHGAHVRDAGRVEAQWLVEGCHAREHAAHGCDARGIPARYVRVENHVVVVVVVIVIVSRTEELAHVGDGRDVPAGDGAVCRNGGSLGFAEGQERRLQKVLARELVGRWTFDFDAARHPLAAVMVPPQVALGLRALRVAAWRGADHPCSARRVVGPHAPTTVRRPEVEVVGAARLRVHGSPARCHTRLHVHPSTVVLCE
eukprot:scaffold74623_cov64-Phaeocystis_antarctica.AAC.1